MNNTANKITELFRGYIQDLELQSLKKNKKLK